MTEENVQVEETTQEEQVDTPEVKTFTQEELDKAIEQRLARESKKHQQAIEDMETRFAEELEKTKMTEKELKDFEDAKRQKELEEIREENERLKAESARRDMEDNARTTLSEKGLPITESVLKFVVRENAEETLKAIDDLGDILAEAKRKEASSDSPRAGGTINKSDNRSMFDILDGK